MKKALSLVLAIAMVFSFALSASAYDFKQFSDAADCEANAYARALGVCTDLNIIAGTDGKVEPNSNVTRAQFITMLYKFMYGGNALTDGLYTKAPYSDVPAWATNYVGWAAANNITAGIGGGKFGSGNSISYIEALTFIIKALGVKPEKEPTFSTDWKTASAVISAELDLDLIRDFVPANGKALTRAECAQLFDYGLQSYIQTYDVTGKRVNLVENEANVSALTKNFRGQVLVGVVVANEYASLVGDVDGYSVPFGTAAGTKAPAGYTMISELIYQTGTTVYAAQLIKFPADMDLLGKAVTVIARPKSTTTLRYETVLGVTLADTNNVAVVNTTTADVKFGGGALSPTVFGGWPINTAANPVLSNAGAIAINNQANVNAEVTAISNNNDFKAEYMIARQYTLAKVTEVDATTVTLKDNDGKYVLAKANIDGTFFKGKENLVLGEYVIVYSIGGWYEAIKPVKVVGKATSATKDSLTIGGTTYANWGPQTIKTILSSDYRVDQKIFSTDTTLYTFKGKIAAFINSEFQQSDKEYFGMIIDADIRYDSSTSTHREVRIITQDGASVIKNIGSYRDQGRTLTTQAELYNRFEPAAAEDKYTSATAVQVANSNSYRLIKYTEVTPGTIHAIDLFTPHASTPTITTILDDADYSNRFGTYYVASSTYVFSVYQSNAAGVGNTDLTKALPIVVVTKGTSGVSTTSVTTAAQTAAAAPAITWAQANRPGSFYAPSGDTIAALMIHTDATPAAASFNAFGYVLNSQVRAGANLGDANLYEILIATATGRVTYYSPTNLDAFEGKVVSAIASADGILSSMTSAGAHEDMTVADSATAPTRAGLIMGADNMSTAALENLSTTATDTVVAKTFVTDFNGNWMWLATGRGVTNHNVAYAVNADTKYMWINDFNQTSGTLTYADLSSPTALTLSIDRTITPNGTFTDATGILQTGTVADQQGSKVWVVFNSDASAITHVFVIYA